MTFHDDRRDKYDHPDTAAIDCAARLPRCRAVCCALETPLSRQDVAEGAARWDPARPYWLARGEDGWCVHLDAASGRCGIHDRRPLACRAYTCEGDPAIWRDFAAGEGDAEGVAALLARCGVRPGGRGRRHGDEHEREHEHEHEHGHGHGHGQGSSRS